MKYDVAVWMAKAGQLEHERNLLLEYLDVKTMNFDPDDDVHLRRYHELHVQVEALRARLREDL